MGERCVRWVTLLAESHVVMRGGGWVDWVSFGRDRVCVWVGFGWSEPHFERPMPAASGISYCLLCGPVGLWPAFWRAPHYRPIALATKSFSSRNWNGLISSSHPCSDVSDPTRSKSALPVMMMTFFNLP